MSLRWCFVLCLSVGYATKPFVRTQKKGDDAEFRADLLVRLAHVEHELHELDAPDYEDDDLDAHMAAKAEARSKAATEESHERHVAIFELRRKETQRTNKSFEADRLREEQPKPKESHDVGDQDKASSASRIAIILATMTSATTNGSAILQVTDLNDMMSTDAATYFVSVIVLSAIVLFGILVFFVFSQWPTAPNKAQSVEELDRLLVRHGVNTSLFGVNNTKTVEDLYDEMKSGNSEIVIDTPVWQQLAGEFDNFLGGSDQVSRRTSTGRSDVWRDVRVAQVNIFIEHEGARFFMYEQKANCASRTREQSLTATCKVGEDPLQVVQAALKSKLNLDEEWCRVHARFDGPPKTRTEFSDGMTYGASYPHMKSRYHMVCYSLELLTPCFGFPDEETFSTVDDRSDKHERCWQWVRIKKKKVRSSQDHQAPRSSQQHEVHRSEHSGEDPAWRAF